MKAIVLDAAGGPENLTLQERPSAPLADGNVRIRNNAVGVNFIDIYQRKGLYPLLTPCVLGQEGAGVVAEGGAGAPFRPGDRVAYLSGANAYAEEIVIDEQATGEGYLRHLVVREGRNTGQALVVLVTAPGERFETGYLVDVLRRLPEVRSIHWAINDTPAEQTNLPTRLLWGDDAIEEEILGLRFRLRPSAFLQTNTEMAEQLYALARGFAALTGVETVFDLYCGTGTIGLALAAQARFVWGLEISEEAIACAIENAELNGIGNAQFFAGNVGQTLEERPQRDPSPPRIRAPRLRREPALLG